MIEISDITDKIKDVPTLQAIWTIFYEERERCLRDARIQMSEDRPNAARQSAEQAIYLTDLMESFSQAIEDKGGQRVTKEAPTSGISV